MVESIFDGHDEEAFAREFFRILDARDAKPVKQEGSMILTRLRHAWLVYTGKLLAVEASIVKHIDLTASDLTTDLKGLLMSLADNIAALGASVESAIAAAKNDAANAVSTAQAEAQAATAKANDLQSQLDAAQTAVNALHAQLSPAPVAVDPNAAPTG